MSDSHVCTPHCDECPDNCPTPEVIEWTMSEIDAFCFSESSGTSGLIDVVLGSEEDEDDLESNGMSAEEEEP